MRTIFSSLFIIFFLGICAQSVNTNVLSYNGLGERAIGNHSIYDALGTNNFNLLDSAQLNFYNPASYSLMSVGNTLFSVGIYGRFSKYSFNSTSEYQFSAMPDHFALGFKVRKRMGMSFGLKPYSVRGYSFNQNFFTGLDSIKYSYSGQGGIQDLFLGFSYGILNRKYSKIGLGFNASYLFGDISNEIKSVLIDPNTSSGGLKRNSISVKTFHYELGAFLRHQIIRGHELTLSTVFSPSQNVNAKSLEELYTASNINALSTYDTLDFIQTKGKIELGLESKFGLAYQLSLPERKRKTRLLHPQLTFLASFVSINPTSHGFEGLSSWQNVTASRVGFGIQYKPEAKIYENISTLKWMEKITYRIGANSSRLPYLSTSGNQYVEQSITFGFGMPILAQQGLSTLNLAICYGKRGVNQSEFTAEEFVTFNFGLVISPSSFDRWFRKRKLD